MRTILRAFNINSPTGFKHAVPQHVSKKKKSFYFTLILLTNLNHVSETVPVMLILQPSLCPDMLETNIQQFLSNLIVDLEFRGKHPTQRTMTASANSVRRVAALFPFTTTPTQLFPGAFHVTPRNKSSPIPQLMFCNQ